MVNFSFWCDVNVFFLWERCDFNGFTHFLQVTIAISVIIFRHASVSSTYPNQSVRPSVRRPKVTLSDFRSVELDMVVNMEVDKVADKLADMAADKKKRKKNWPT